MTIPPLPHVPIVIEGNIGAGKSTFLRALEAAVQSELNHEIERPLCTCGKIPGEAIVSARLTAEDMITLQKQLSGGDPTRTDLKFCTCPGSRKVTQPVLSVAVEPIAAWTHLKDFYNDPHRYAFPLQKQIMENQAEPDPEALFQIQERCAGSAFHVFTQVLVEQGYLDPDYELESLDRALSLFPLAKQIPPFIVYVDASPAKCLERIARRDRINEAAEIDLAYLEKLEKHYKEFLNACRQCGSRVYRISMEEDMDADQIQGLASAFLGSMIDLRLRQMNHAAQGFEVQLLTQGKKIGSGEEVRPAEI